MILSSSVVLLSLLMTSNAMNKPVYKVALKQKGYAQFLEYDVDVPALNDFTVCLWVRFFELRKEQSIFNYVVKGNNRVVRMWLEKGSHVKVSFNEMVTSTFYVDIVKDTWHHLCLSYQADFGALALYADSRLAACEVSQSLYGFVIPGGGSIIIGYGITSKDGSPTGLQGEVFGVNMILTSTIERNFTAKYSPQYVQKPAQRNKIREVPNIEYIVFNDLHNEDPKQKVFRNGMSSAENTAKSHVRITTPYSVVDHDIGLDLKNQTTFPSSGEHSKEIFDMVPVTHTSTTRSTIVQDDDNKISFWKIMNPAGHVGKYKSPQSTRTHSTREQSSSGTQELPTVSEFQMPPPIGNSHNYYEEKNLEIEKPPNIESIYKTPEDNNKSRKSISEKKQSKEISEVELPPPPPPQKNQGVYGQWTSSKYAGSVLNYLKSIKFYKKDKRVPATIPLNKVSDSHPYASELKATIVRPLQIQRRAMDMDKHFQTQNAYVYPPTKTLTKREISKQQINVEILENDIREDILRSHAQTNPKHVDVKSRGEADTVVKDHRFYRNIPAIDSSEESMNSGEQTTNDKPKPYFHESGSLVQVLPFLKSNEYFIGDTVFDRVKKITSDHDMYIKSLSKKNKWHNVKSYNNDYTPRKLDILQDGSSNIYSRIEEINKKHPSIRLKYKPELNKVVSSKDNLPLAEGRKLAQEVSNQSDNNKNSVSILKYNHGYLPGHSSTKNSNVNHAMHNINQTPKHNVKGILNDFNKPVKIGNALSEQHIIGVDDENRRKSFEGGHNRVPDIDRYRSDFDDGNDQTVPPSLSPRVCKNVELYDHILYVQPDESIDLTRILSPVRERNIAINFIIQNYRKCTLEDSPFERNSLVLLHWNRTPVRIFGGATPTKTTDLCGFF